jgi:putative DNA primase/helicase
MAAQRMNDRIRPLPRADELKRWIKPRTFYARELPDAPALKARDGGWSQNVPCPFHDDADPSFGVHLETGAYRCFGCDAEGGGIVDFVMQRHGLSLAEARAKLAADYGVDGQRQVGPRSPSPEQARSVQEDREERPRCTLEPVPETALASRPTTHPKHGEPSATWEYRDAAGRLLFFNCRFDLDRGRKQFAPLTFNGRLWQWKAPPEPRPLYGQDRLAAKPDALVVFTEGEKAADAAAQLFPDGVTVTTPNGARAPGKADFHPLAARRVVIWPDNDDPGSDYARVVETLVRSAGAASVERLDLAALACEPGTGSARTLPPGWDAADALTEGWTAETLAEALRRGPVVSNEAGEADLLVDEAAAESVAAAVDKLPNGYVRRHGGIYWVKPLFDDKGVPRRSNGPPLFICPHVDMLAVTRDETGGDFGRLIEFEDLDANARREVIADRERQKDQAELFSRLAASGFEVGNHRDSKLRFVELLRRSTPAQRARSVKRTGWTRSGAFVLPDVVIGESDEPVVLAIPGERPAFGVRGTLDDWRSGVARLCEGNSRLQYCVSIPFASPLLASTNTESGGFHLRGDSLKGSSSGKTTIQRAVASVCGSPEYVQQWRSTDNALEHQAIRHNDSVLILDELGQIDPRKAGDAAYLLANGVNKARLEKDSSGKPLCRWRLLFLSSGEISLRQHMEEAGKKTRAGQEVRMAEIPADAGAGLGAFEDLHGYPDGGAFALALTDAAAQWYGTPFVAWIEALVRDRAAVPSRVRELRDQCTARLLASIADPPGQVRRVAGRFALVAAAGELATAEGITGWPPGSTLDAAAVCFQAWLTARGGAGPVEETQLLKQVELWFENNSGRFRWKSRPLDSGAPEVGKSAGFKHLPDGEQGALRFFVLPQTFQQEVVKGYDANEAARLLMRHGLLTPGGDGRPARKERLPGYKNPTWCYVFDRLGTEVPPDEL